MWWITTLLTTRSGIWSSIWHTGYVEDTRILEKVQRRWTKRIDGLDSLSYADRLQSLNLYSVQGRLLHADLIQCWKIFNGRSCIEPNELFCLPPQTRTRGHRHKIFPMCTRSDVRKRSFTVRCITTWNALPAEAACAPNLTKFKAMLHLHLHDSLFAFV